MTTETMPRVSDYRHWAQEAAALLFHARLSKDGLAEWKPPISPLASKMDEIKENPTPQRQEEWSSACLLADKPILPISSSKSIQITVPSSVDWNHLRNTISKLETDGPQEIERPDLAKAGQAINEVLRAIRRFG